MDKSKLIDVLLVVAQIAVKYGPAAAAFWQRLFEAQRLPTPADYAELDLILEKEGRAYFAAKEA